MKLIAFFLITCAYRVTSSKLPPPLAPDNETTNVIMSQSNTDSLSGRDINSDYYGSYMLQDYGNLSFISDWLSNIIPTFQQPLYDTQTYYQTSTDYSQEQWSSPYWSYEWNQNRRTNPDANRYYYPNAAEDATYTYHAVPNQQQPTVAKKISTIINTEDLKEIKHKVIISPEFPNGTGYISIGETGGKQTSANSSKDRKVYYRF